MHGSHAVKFITAFPDFKENGFDLELYNHQFRDSNVIISAVSNNISYPEHWGPLSIKCCQGGKENYLIGKRFYSVDETNFLVLNNDQYYSSYIYSETDVHSFTLNFSRDLQNAVINSLLQDDGLNLDDPNHARPEGFSFTERLTKKNQRISYLLGKLKSLITLPPGNTIPAEEALIELLGELLKLEKKLVAESDKIDVSKRSTKTELLKRLHYVKDYIDSCYQNEISLDDLSGVANLNSAYLLRKFKKLFEITPHQYLIKRRMTAAAELLRKNDYPITEVCHEVGYADLTSFGKLFKQYHQLSPENFKRAAGKPL